MRRWRGRRVGVEGGQIFQRAAAAGEDDEVDRVRRAGIIEIGDGGFNFGGGGLALHAGREEQDVEAGVAAADNVKKVADDGAGGRGDDADGARKCRQRALARGVEKAFGFESLLELLEGELERAGANGLKGFGHELHLAALVVDADPAASEDVLAVFGRKRSSEAWRRKRTTGSWASASFRVK